MKNFLLSGVGGQGTVLASRLIAQCAIDKGEMARTAETIGMAQRGGCVVSHVRIGDTFSPLIPQGEADVILGFEPSETVRVLPYLKKGGTVIVSKKAIQPVTASLSGKNFPEEKMLSYLREHVTNFIEVDGEKLCKELSSSKVLNVILLGAAIGSGCLETSLAEMEETIKKRVPEKYRELNLRALRLGAGEL